MTIYFKGPVCISGSDPLLLYGVVESVILGEASK